MTEQEGPGTQHRTVLLKEAVDALAITDARRGGWYVDGTFGRGGHSRRILERLDADGRLLVFDKDPEAIAVARAWARSEPRLHVEHDSFAALERVLARLGGQRLQGVLLDLGISSPQVDQAQRGFS